MPHHNEMSDAVFMAGPILAATGRLTGERKYFDAAHFDSMRKLCLRRDGLYRHSPLCEAAWGRGNGFPALGLALALSDWPDDHPAKKGLIAEFQKHVAALLPHQDKKTGCWHQVIDRPESYDEYSCTGMIGFAVHHPPGLAEGRGPVERRCGVARREGEDRDRRQTGRRLRGHRQAEDAEGLPGSPRDQRPRRPRRSDGLALCDRAAGGEIAWQVCRGTHSSLRPAVVPMAGWRGHETPGHVRQAVRHAGQSPRDRREPRDAPGLQRGRRRRGEVTVSHNGGAPDAARDNRNLWYTGRRIALPIARPKVT